MRSLAGARDDDCVGQAGEGSLKCTVIPNAGNLNKVKVGEMRNLPLLGRELKKDVYKGGQGADP